MKKKARRFYIDGQPVQWLSMDPAEFAAIKWTLHTTTQENLELLYFALVYGRLLCSRNYPKPLRHQNREPLIENAQLIFADVAQAERFARLVAMYIDTLPGYTGISGYDPVLMDMAAHGESCAAELIIRMDSFENPFLIPYFQNLSKIMPSKARKCAEED